MQKTSEHISNFLTCCRETQIQFKFHTEELNRLNQATQDILHQIELGSYKERGKYATRLAKVRQTRRVSKDFVDINNAFYTYTQTDEFKKVYRKLEQLLGDVRKQENYVATHRKYKSKVIKVSIDKEEPI